jgi:hypothetical protein
MSLCRGAFRLQEDDFGLELEDPSEQCLLVIGESGTLVALDLEFGLHSSNASDEIPFVEALKRVV